MSDTSPAPRKPQSIASTLIELAPSLAYVATYSYVRTRYPDDAILIATAVLLAFTIPSMAWLWLKERRVPVLGLFAVGITLIFAGLSFVFRDPIFVKVRPTVTASLMGLAFIGSVWIGRNLLRAVLEPTMGDEIRFSDRQWTRLAYAIGAMFLMAAGVNELVWRFLPEPVWVAYSAWGDSLLFAVMFGIAFYWAHSATEKEEAAAARDRTE
jgi:intracellular septation protein